MSHDGPTYEDLIEAAKIIEAHRRPDSETISRIEMGNAEYFAFRVEVEELVERVGISGTAQALYGIPLMRRPNIDGIRIIYMDGHVEEFPMNEPIVLAATPVQTLTDRYRYTLLYVAAALVVFVAVVFVG